MCLLGLYVVKLPMSCLIRLNQVERVLNDILSKTVPILRLDVLC